MTKRNDDEAPDLEHARKELEEAESLYESARREADAARSACTVRLNQLNEKQRKFDAAVAAVRKGAPRDSDWWRNQLRGLSGDG